MTELDPHVQKAMYGTPELKPDETHRYLGTFRERVYAVQTPMHLGESDYLTAWTLEFKHHPQGTLLLNGHMEMADLEPYIKLATAQKVGFTLKTDAAFANSEFAVVYTADQAVDIATIDIANQVVVQPTPVTPPKKWYQKLFK